LTDLGGKTCIFSHPVYLFLREFSLQDSRGGSVEFRHGNMTLENPSPELLTLLIRELTGRGR
ncbi:TPA: hypothetical protein ACV8C4_004991, partial [Escherichia coli]